MPILPSGTVTFLFTDIEGSTKLWELYPEPMRLALAHHDILLRQTIQQHNGYVFKTIGDAFCAAFSTATDGLNAALAAQQALHTEPWPQEIETLRVRMALHTGVAEEREGDYFGPSVNRVARLLAIGHGGQTLLSQAVRQLLSADTPLADQGTHRLKDLQQPEHVFQLLAPGLPTEFPPLRSLRNTNLPIQSTSFIGREQEMEDVKRLLGTTRLLTLTGTGGCGKTRLALQVAIEVLENHPDGVWLVELASISEPTLAVQTVATVLGLRDEPGRPLIEILTDYLKSKSLLLLVDNCEHLVAECAFLTNTLLRSCPDLKILATSRAALHVPGEHTWRVPSLLPPDPAHLPTEEKDLPVIVAEYDAVRLFIDRVAAHRADFYLNSQNARAVAQVCHRLDGIPLALEMAAARTRALTVDQIAARLDNRFRLLTGRSQMAPTRQQTLRALIDWSYDLLTQQEQTLLQHLCIFAGGWSLEAAEKVCSNVGITEEDMIDILTSLVDKSLVVFEERNGVGRYHLLETVRQYAWERLGDGAQLEILRGKHLAYFLAVAAEAKMNLQGAEQQTWLERLEVEHDNLRAALLWCREAEGPIEAGLRLAATLWRFWFVRGYLSEGRTHLETLLSQETAQERTKERGKALSGAACLAFSQGDYACAHSYYEQSLAIFQELGDKKGMAHSLGGLGLLTHMQENYAAARPPQEQSLALFRELDNKPGIALALLRLGNLAYGQGNYAVARSCYEESLSIRRELGDKRGITAVLSNLGMIVDDQNDYDSARSLLEECLSMRRELEDRRGIAHALLCLGIVAYNQNDYAGARSFYEGSLAIEHELGNKPGIATALSNLGSVAREQGDYITASSLLQESLSIRRELGDKWGIAFSLFCLGNVAYSQSDYAAAHSLYEESLSVRRELGDKWGIAHSLRNLGRVAYKQDDYAVARSCYEESLVIFQELENKQGMASCLEALARLASTQAQEEQAARLWGTAEALREAFGSPLPPNERAEYDREVAEARRALGEDAFTAAWTEGRAMTREQVIVYALAEERA